MRVPVYVCVWVCGVYMCVYVFFLLYSSACLCFMITCHCIHVHVYTSQRIRLHFTSFNLENGGSSCRYDYVAIYNGGSATAPQKLKVCGTSRPGDIVINGNTAFVKFSTDYSVTKPGFRIRYSAGETMFL